MGKQRPLCRCCGKPIPKRTTYVTFGVAPVEVGKGRGRTERPNNRAEVQRYVNGEVVSVRFSTTARVNGEPITDGHWSKDCAPNAVSVRTIVVPKYVDQATCWDGESYTDPYFCKGLCAQRYGRFAIEHPGYDTKAYADALADQAARAD